MTRVTASILVLTLLFSLNFRNVRAQEPIVLQLPKILTPTGERDPGEAISPLRRGDRSPFTGLALSPRAVASILAHYKFLQEQIDIEVERAKRETESKFTFEKEGLQIQFTADKEVLSAQLARSESETIRFKDLLRKEIDSRPNLTLWATLSFVGGIGITILTVFAINSATN
jgi:hypothetical protein